MVHAVVADSSVQDYPTLLHPVVTTSVEKSPRKPVKAGKAFCSPVLDVCAAVISDAPALAKLHQEGYVRAHREMHCGTKAGDASLEEWEAALGGVDFKAELLNAAKAIKKGALSEVRLLKCVDSSKGKLVGYALFELRTKGSAKRKQRYCELVNIVVSAEYRGCGAGRLLFDGVRSDLARAAPMYSDDIRLYVAHQNEGPLNWYRRLGFGDAGWQSEKVAGMEVKFLRMMMKKTA